MALCCRVHQWQQQAALLPVPNVDSQFLSQRLPHKLFSHVWSDDLGLLQSEIATRGELCGGIGNFHYCPEAPNASLYSPFILKFLSIVSNSSENPSCSYCHVDSFGASAWSHKIPPSFLRRLNFSFLAPFCVQNFIFERIAKAPKTPTDERFKILPVPFVLWDSPDVCSTACLFPGHNSQRWRCVNRGKKKATSEEDYNGATNPFAATVGFSLIPVLWLLLIWLHSDWIILSMGNTTTWGWERKSKIHYYRVGQVVSL